jgi:hypothetical protein
MTSYLKEEYRGMTTVCHSHREHRENDKIEIIWKIKAYEGCDLKGEWDFVAMRVDPHNPNPHDRLYLAHMEHILKSGRDLVDRIRDHH